MRGHEYGVCVLQEGLVGNRVITAARLWDVVLAMQRAFPVLISPGVDAVTASAGSSAQGLEELWVLQVSYILIRVVVSCWGSWPFRLWVVLATSSHASGHPRAAAAC